VEKWETSEKSEEEDHADDESAEALATSDIPMAKYKQSAHSINALESEMDDSGDEDLEDSSDVAMVPMADILNARYGCENVRLLLLHLQALTLARPNYFTSAMF